MKTENKYYIDDQDLKPPIFVLSAKRSGSTLMKNVLDVHPNIYSSTIDIGFLCKALYNTIYLMVADMSDGLPEPERQLMSYKKCRQEISVMVRDFVHKKNKIFWCDKSEESLNYLDDINKVFPNAKYICLYRHCLDVVQSFISINRLGFFSDVCPYIKESPENVVAALARYWVDKNTIVHEFESTNSSNCIRVNYEELVTNPNDTLDKLFNFIGVSWDDDILKNAFEQKNKCMTEGDPKFYFSKNLYSNSIGSGAVVPVNIIPETLMMEMEGLLAKIGYGTIHSYYSENHREIGTNTAGSASAMDIIIKNFNTKIRKKMDEARIIGGICKLVVNGGQGGEWIIDLTKSFDGIKATGNKEADCTIMISEKSIKKIIARQTNVVEAFQNGEIAVAGNDGLAINFGRLLLS